MRHHRRRRNSGFWRSPAGVVFAVFLGIAMLLLVLEHQAHVLQAWPLLFLIVCGGMHLLMHRAHGGGGGHGD